ncbi:MAG: DsbA family protein, partial [Armatimonadetes bacterium]|nr:DsbA family protein [Armatimonadota bacterium]
VMPPRPPFLPMHNALLAAEYATVTHGADAAHTFIAVLYRAYWEKHEDISDHDVLQGYAEAQGLDAAPLLASVAKDEFVANILDFDDDAYAAGIRHVPTFVFGAEERLAEAPYTDLARATERLLVRIEKQKGK